MEPPELASIDLLPVKQECSIAPEDSVGDLLAVSTPQPTENSECSAAEEAPEATMDAGQDAVLETAAEGTPEASLEATPEEAPEALPETANLQATPPAAMDQDSAGSPTTGDGPPATNSWSSVKCVFCEQIMTTADAPKLLECLHAACSNCINAKLNEPNHESADVVEVNTLVCAVCSVMCSTANIIENQFLLEVCNENENATVDLNKSLSDLKCSSCQDSAPATSWCVDCAEYICNGCVQAHQRLKITKEHTIKSKEEAEMDSQSLASTSINKNFYCNIHPQEQLTLFCETCDRLTCRDCQLTEHRDHKYKFSHEIAAESRNFISSLLSDVSYKRVLLKSATKVIEDRQVLITEKKSALLQEITQMVHKLTRAIIQRSKQLAARLNEVCDAKQKTLTEKKVALEQLSLVTDHCIDFVNNAVNKGSDMALLFSKRQITQHLQRIKSRRADIPNPEIPVRIHLATDKLAELIRVLSTIGNIIVDGRVYPSGQSSSGQSGQTNNANSSERPAANQAAAAAATNPNIANHPGSHSSNHPGSHAVNHAVNHHPASAPAAPPQLAPPQQGYVSPQSYFPPGSSMRQPSPMGQPGPPRAATPPQNPHMLPVPAQVARNLNMLRHPNHQNAVGLMRTHHQQVTSSTHPIVDGRNLTLQSMLSPRGAGPGPGPAGGPLPPHHQAGRIPYPHATPVPSVHRGIPMGHPRYQMQEQLVGPHPYQRQLAHPPQPPPQQQHTMHYSQYGSGAGPVGAGAGPTVAVTSAVWGTRASSQSPHSAQAQAQAQAHHQWHIPQHAAGSNHSSARGAHQAHHSDDNSFKITLKQQVSPSPQQVPPHLSLQTLTPVVSITTGPVPGAIPIKQSNSARAAVGPPSVSVTSITAPAAAAGAGSGSGSAPAKHSPFAVSSSAPKTPSPSLIKPDDVERSLDKYCLESVSDLMATIAKLDSNGIVVIPETPQQQQQQQQAAPTGDSPQVDSSTGDTRHHVDADGDAEGEGQVEAVKNGVDNEPQKDDPNEDWCAVCMDGGELVCCDKCPKVFHMHCHIPSLEALPDDTWQCLLCTDLSEVLAGLSGPPPEQPCTQLSPAHLKVARRLLLELYCQYEPSLPFREIVGPEVAEYHQLIDNPMSLEVIRNKLDCSQPNHYTDLRQIITDVRLIFKNAYIFNSKDTQVYSDAKTLEEFFDHLIEKWLPSYAYVLDNSAPHANENGGVNVGTSDDEDTIPPAKRIRRLISE